MKSIIAKRTCRLERTKAPIAAHRFPASSTLAFPYISAPCDAVAFSAHVAAILGCCSGVAPSATWLLANGFRRPVVRVVPAAVGARPTLTRRPVVTVQAHLQNGWPKAPRTWAQVGKF